MDMTDRQARINVTRDFARDRPDKQAESPGSSINHILTYLHNHAIIKRNMGRWQGRSRKRCDGFSSLIYCCTIDTRERRYEQQTKPSGKAGTA